MTITIVIVRVWWRVRKSRKRVARVNLILLDILLFNANKSCS